MARALLGAKAQKVAILNFGTLLETALEAAEQLDATVVDMRFVKPLDRDMILNLAKSHDLLVTVEENSIAGGAGSAVSELLANESLMVPVIHLGLPDKLSIMPATNSN